MATERPQDIPRESAERTRRAEAGTDRDIRQMESSLDRAAELVDRGLAGEDELGDAAWQLTLAQWGLGWRDTPRQQWRRQGVMLAAATATLFYLIYRLMWTLNLTNAAAAAFSIVLVSAEIYAGISLVLYFFQVWRLIEPPLRRPTPGRTVDVFVTTYNEDVALLRGTLTACIDMDYPHTTYVLDDGARPEVQELADSLGVRYISRTDRTHAKAGNLNNALEQTFGEFVVILDADHVPYRHYITRLIGYFDDSRLGFVQAPHTTYNLDNFMGQWRASSKAYWEDVRIFFEAVQLGKNRYGVACFCGSAAIFRRQAIVDAGLFATENDHRGHAHGHAHQRSRLEVARGERGDGRRSGAGRRRYVREPAIAMGRGESERLGLRQSVDHERAHARGAGQLSGLDPVLDHGAGASDSVPDAPGDAVDRNCSGSGHERRLLHRRRMLSRRGVDGRQGGVERMRPTVGNRNGHDGLVPSANSWRCGGPYSAADSRSSW